MVRPGPRPPAGPPAGPPVGRAAAPSAVRTLAAHMLRGLVLLAFVYGAYPVQITHLHVPQYVSNGSHAAILDCEYALGPRESINASGLVVKWFFNDGPAPVYQWIPPQRPQELGLLRGRLDLGYQATKSNASRHRALYIRNPTTDLSGEWKCLVSTFDDEDFMTKKMVVYAYEKQFELTQSRPSHEESVNITCRAQGVFPEPKMALLRQEDNTRLRRAAVLPGVAVQTHARSGAYDIVATKLLDSEELSTPTILACELRVPATNYTRLKSLVYYPGKLNYPYSSESTEGGASLPAVRLFWACLAVSLVSRLFG